MKPTKCPAREKKMRQEKRKKKGGEKAKSKNFKILLSAHARNFASGSEGREVFDL